MFHDFWKQILTICQIPITELRFQLDPLIQFFHSTLFGRLLSQMFLLKLIFDKYR